MIFETRFSSFFSFLTLTITYTIVITMHYCNKIGFSKTKVEKCKLIIITELPLLTQRQSSRYIIFLSSFLIDNFLGDLIN